MERLSIDEVIAHCNRQTRDYERLNGKAELENADISLNFIKHYWEHRQVAEWLRELKTYKDAEEQGLLLRLPCKVGTQVWKIKECSGGGRIPNWHEIYNVNFALELLSDFGTTVFLTKEEAEQALAEMKEV